MTRRDGRGGRAPPIVVVAAGDRAEWRSTISSTSSCPRETFVSARREGGREGLEMADEAASSPSVPECDSRGSECAEALTQPRAQGWSARRRGGGGCDGNLALLLFRA